jgi:hypothetical protein
VVGFNMYSTGGGCGDCGVVAMRAWSCRYWPVGTGRWYWSTVNSVLGAELLPNMNPRFIRLQTVN